MIDLIKFGTVNLRLVAMMGLDRRPDSRSANFVIAGGTGSGKQRHLIVLECIFHA